MGFAASEKMYGDKGIEGVYEDIIIIIDMDRKKIGRKLMAMK